jgi:hypothetical protein
MGMEEDLPAKEAVLRRDVSFDIDEAGHAVGFLVCQHERGQPAHGMPHQVEAVNPLLSEGSQGSIDQEGNRDLFEVTAPGLAAAGGVVGEERLAVRALTENPLKLT